MVHFLTKKDGEERVLRERKFGFGLGSYKSALDSSIYHYSYWFGIIGSVTSHKFTAVPIKACCISCAFFDFVLRKTRKMSCDKVLKAIKVVKMKSCYNIITDK